MPIKKAKKYAFRLPPSKPRHKWRFRYEKWQKPLAGIVGTIRSVPENYYIAEVRTNGRLVFGNIEAMTRRLSKATVRKWWKENRK